MKRERKRIFAKSSIKIEIERERFGIKERRKTQSFFFFLVAVSISSLSYILSQPKFNIFYLSFIFYLPLHILWRKYGQIKQFLFAGFVSYFAVIHWITHAITHYGGFSYAFSLIPLSLLSLALSAFFLLFGYMRSQINTLLKIPFSLADPIIWVSTEYIKTFLFTGFPWALVGYSLWQKPSLIQTADIGGVYIVSFFIILIQGFLCDTYDRISNRISSPALFVSFIITFLLSSLYLTYSFMRKTEIEINLASVKDELPVVVVQPNIPQDIKWTPELKSKYLKKNIELTISAIDYPYKSLFAVWPETALTFILDLETELKNELLDFASKGFYIIAGGIGYSREIKDGRAKEIFYNRAYFITPQKEIYHYDKTHLVIFGEYIPLRSAIEKIPFIKKIIEDVEKVAGDFTPGKEVKSLGKEIKVGVPICFESIFPQITRKMVKDGADFIAVITNDGWFGYSSGPFQHFSASVFRAIETRRFVVRSANTGISGVFSPTGKIMYQTKLLEERSFLTKIKPLKIQSFYIKYGDLFSISCISILALLFILSLIIKK
jgi:apolipoprotein N-acyltransferase